MKRRREARATLEEALAVFERIGAALWAERARAELKRISGRAASPGALTPAEERVAALVAEGKTNRRSPPRSSSPTAPWRGISRASSGSSGSAIASRALRWRLQTQGIAALKHGGLSRFSRVRPRPSLDSGGYESHQEQKEKER